MRKFTLVETVFILMFAFSLAYIWTKEIAIPTEQIPTITNGLVSSISVIIGFTGALIVFTMSKDTGKLELSSSRSVFYIIGIGGSLSLFWSLYNYIMEGNFILAFKIAMVSLLLASTILIDFIAYYMKEHMVQGNKQSYEQKKA